MNVSWPHFSHIYFCKSDYDLIGSKYVAVLLWKKKDSSFFNKINCVDYIFYYTYLFTYLLTYLFTYLLITHLHTYLLTHLRTFSLTHSLTHTHILTHSQTNSRNSKTQSHTHSHARSHAHTLTLTHTHSHARSHAHTHSHSHAHSHTHTLTHSHILTRLSHVILFNTFQHFKNLPTTHFRHSVSFYVICIFQLIKFDISNLQYRCKIYPPPFLFL